MEGIANLLPSVINNSANLRSYLHSCEEHISFHGKDKANQEFIKLINSNLTKPNSRLNGLLILEVALRQCTEDVFVDNAAMWMKCCLQGSLDKHVHVANISFHVLGTLLKAAVKFPDVKKFAASHIVPNILVHSKREINHETVYNFLECCCVCMQEYSGSCSDYSKSILLFVTQLLDAEPYLLQAAAKCFALTSHVKSIGTQGISYQNVWKNNQLKVVHTLHYYLDLLFSNVDEIQTANRPSDDNVSLLTEEFDEKASSFERMQFIMKYIRGLSRFLQVMLLGSFPAAKTVLPDHILGLVCRGLAVTCNSLGNFVTNDTVALKSVLPFVHIDLLNVLIALITCCGRNLIQYGPVICKLLNQELKWTAVSDWPYTLLKPYSQLRCTVYNCLSCWLSTTRAASSIDKVMEELVLYLLQDVRLKKPTITLTAASTAPKKGKSKSGIKLVSNVEEKKGPSLHNTTVNNELCLHALKSLQLILYSSVVFMKPSVYKSIQESVVSLLFEIQDTGDIPLPYSKKECRKELYLTLLALCMEPHPTTAPPLNYALNIFKSGVKDSCSEVSLICITALSNIGKITQPSAPPIGSVLQYEIAQIEEKDYDVDVSNNSVHSGCTNQETINDIPLSALPNLNNVIVLKVIQNDGENNTRSDSPAFQSFQRTTVNIRDSNTVNHYQSLGDIIGADDIVVNGVHDDCNDDNQVEVDDVIDVHISDKQRDNSLLAKINGISTDDDMLDNRLVTREVLPKENGLFNNKVEPAILDKRVLSNNEECPPVKRIKVVEDNSLGNSDITTDVRQDESNLENGISNDHEEEIMMNCFVDAIQE